MRFVAGRDAVAELLLAGALWRSCCWPGRRGGKPSGISCCRGAVAKQLLAGNRWHRGLPAGALKRSSMGKSLLLRRRRCGCIGKSLPLHGRRCGCIGKPTNAHKREGPGRDINISPEPLLFIALRKGNTPGEVAAGMQCWRSCRCNYAGIARKVAANARIA